MGEKGVQVIDRTFDIIELLSDYVNGLGITEISTKLNLNKSTVHRIVSALVSRGYLKKDDSLPIYKLGLKFIEVSSISLNDIELKSEAKTYLYELSNRFNQPTHLGILENMDVIYIDKVDCTSSLRLYSQIGKRIDAHASSLGKVLLANLNHNILSNLLENYTFSKYTDKTICNKEDFLKELKIVKEQNYSIDNEEHDIGIKCVAAPVFDYKGRTIAAISIAGSVTSIDETIEPEVIQAVKSCANKISSRLGYVINNN